MPNQRIRAGIAKCLTVAGIVAMLLLAASIADGDEVASWVSTTDMELRLTAQPAIPMGTAPQAGSPQLRVDPETRYQTILGMGASLEHTTCANLWRLTPEKRADVMESLVSPENGIGMNTMRICIGTPDFTGDPWYSYNDMPPGEKDPELKHFGIGKDRAYILPVLKLALEKNPDLLLYASPWSPPGWMKTCDDLIGGHLYPRYYDVYAQYFVKFIQAYEAEGLPIYAVTPQNEPGVNKRDDVLSWWYPSCQWSLLEDSDTWWPVDRSIMGIPERDFIRDSLGPALEKAQLDTKIWCFDHNFNNLWYPRNILNDPAAARYVDGTAFHPYVGEPSSMGAFKREFPEKNVYLTEGSTFGLAGAAKIISYFRNGASSYNAWVTMTDSNGGPNNGPFEATETCITLDAATLDVRYNFDYYMYGHFMKFVQRGAVRVESEYQSEGIHHLAFANPDGSLILVVVNPGNDENVLNAVCEAQAFRIKVPRQSVVTMKWQRATRQ